jgi:CSLREA domain-containing protein
MKYWIVILALGWQLTATADSFLVNRLSDGVDADPGDGLCEVTQGVGDCSLRAALNEVNELGGSHDINLGAGVHMISLVGIDDDGLVGDLDVFAATVNITGLSPELSIIDGNFTGRVMQVINGADLTLNNLTIRNGYADHADEYLGGGLNADMRTTGHTQVNLGNVHFINNIANTGGGVYLLANVSMNA